MKTLILPLKRKWFEAIKSGKKTEEFRLKNEYWKKRLVERHYDRIVITLGYPKRSDASRRIVMPYLGYSIKVVTSEEWGNEPQIVFAIRLNASVSLCRVCGGGMRASKVLVPGIYGSEDFGGDFGKEGTTMSSGPATHPPKNCLKCADCGHSFIPAEIARPDDA